ncbi:MAG: type II secretion system F family protein [Chloroflexi bacterium]|nr:type II secretion system F family protein [Chloroflexota bacterium]
MDIITLLPFILAGVAILVAIILIAVGVSNANEVDPLQERLADYATEEQVKVNLEEIEMSVPFTQRVLLPILRGIAAFTTQFTPEETLKKTEHQIEIAGSPNGMTPSVFWAMRFVAMLGLGPIGAWLGRSYGVLGIVGGGLGLAAFGFMMPQMWLSSKVQRRQDGIIKALPDALDLMSICVEAGLGFDQAMDRVYEKWDNDLALEFGRVVKEIQIGKTRREALKNMDRRIEVRDVTSFTSAIIQADQLGVSITRVLKIQSEQMRIKRRQRAQEKAQQAPVKMMIPMVLFIFPSIWLVILGPAAVQIYQQFF